ECANSYLGRLSLRRENTPPRHAVECVNVNVSTPVTQSDRARQCAAAHRPVDHLGKLGPTLRRHIGTIRFAAAAAERDRCRGGDRAVAACQERFPSVTTPRRFLRLRGSHHPHPFLAATILAMSIFFICIIASKAR